MKRRNEMSVVIDFFMKRPDLLPFLSKELGEMLIELVRMERMKLRQGGSGGLPQSAVDACVAAVDDKLMSQIVGDARRSNVPGWIKPEGGKPVERGSGWAKPAPLEGSVPGIRHIDDIAKHFDNLEKAEAASGFERRI
jgi:hypothetical protein